MAVSRIDGGGKFAALGEVLNKSRFYAISIQGKEGTALHVLDKTPSILQMPSHKSAAIFYLLTLNPAH